MTDEERAAAEAEKAREARRESRKSRMIATQLTAYGVSRSATEKALLGGGGRGRGKRATMAPRVGGK
jgi:hypothetical protein